MPEPAIQPGLGGAIARHYEAQDKQSDADKAAALAQLDADAKLYGTAAYAALPADYRRRIEARALELARTAHTEGGAQ